MAVEGKPLASSGPDIDQPILLDLLTAILARIGDERWKFELGDFWCQVALAGYPFQPQGWKAHVSATPLSAPVVLARCAVVLVRNGCAFKFASDLEKARILVDRNQPRGAGGKFITAYPANDEQFRQVTAELDEATQDLHGPKILSDQQLRPGSLVSYRYGVAGAEPVLTNDGSFTSVLVAPDGTEVADERLAWFSPPAWATSPLPGAAAPRAPESVRLAGRFTVRRAIRHASKGGVFVATDTRTDTDVIIKQARRHVGAGLDGRDCRDDLRHEAQMLDEFAPLGISPRKITLFEQQGDLFLAEELIPGERLEKRAAGGFALTTAIALATRLVDVFAAAQSTGLVLRDFTPSNLMVTPDEEFRLIDLEAAVAPGVRVARCYTPGFAAPEQVNAPPFGSAPGQEADLFSLGATLFYLLTGMPPVFPPDVPARRSLSERLAELLTTMAADNAPLAALTPLICGLMDEIPANRWTAARAREYLRQCGPREGCTSPMAPGRGSPGPRDLDCMVRDGLAYVLKSMTPEQPRLWKSSGAASATDACNVQHGASGVLAILVRAAKIAEEPGLREAVRTAAEWIDGRLDSVPRILPGLYFGRSGTAWALHDAAAYLDEPAMAARAVRLAERVPIADWGSPDVTHGLAGAGLAHLYLWQATGLDGLRQRAMLCADAVLAAARGRGTQTLWPISRAFGTSLAGLEHYGFAHGVAGAGTFLMYAGVAGKQDEYLAAALAAGDTLSEAARLTADSAWWPAAPEDNPADPGFQHWCSGASGIGAFLIRLWHVTGEARFLGLAERAAVTIRHRRWQAGNSACCGLAGDGEFLLDMACLTGQLKYTRWAGEIAELLYARRVYLDGLAVAHGEGSDLVTAGYNSGLGGIVGFLMRLSHHGPRMWMPDTLLPPRQVPVCPAA